MQLPLWATASRSALDRIPRRTNECWLGDDRTEGPLYVCGHRFLLRLAGPALDIWRLIDGRHTVAQIADVLDSQFPHTGRAVILADVIACIRHLEHLGLAAWSTRPLFEDVRLDD